jgi:putative ABC transport system substrate-binding protein
MKCVAGFVLAVALVAGVPVPGAAQRAPAKIPRIGILSPAASPSTKLFDAFREGLRDLGYIDGQNITIEYRLFAGDYSRLPAMTADLVRLPVDIIVADGTTIAKIVHDATRTIPIVIAAGGDPVAAGLAESLAHPGDNVTGVVLLLTEVSAKRLQLLKDAFPAISRVAALWDPAVLRTTSALPRRRQVSWPCSCVGLRSPRPIRSPPGSRRRSPAVPRASLSSHRGSSGTSAPGW